jgi:hypothetical protein
MALFSLLTLWTAGPFCEAVEIVLYVFQRSFLSYVFHVFCCDQFDNDLSTSVLFGCCVLSLCRGDALSYMNLKGRYISTTDVCHLLINARSKVEFCNRSLPK